MWGPLRHLGAKRRKVSLQAYPPGRSPRSSWVVSQKHRPDLISAEKLPFLHIISRRQSEPSAGMRGPSLAALPTSPTSPAPIPLPSSPCTRSVPAHALGLLPPCLCTCRSTWRASPSTLGPASSCLPYMPHLRAFPARGGHQRSMPHSAEGPL